MIGSNMAERLGRTLTAISVIAFAVAIVMVVAALSMGFLRGVIRKAQEAFPPGVLLVRPRTMNVSVLSFSTGAITDSVVQKVRALTGVEYVAPQMALKMPLRAEGDVLGQNASTDAMVVGIDPTMVKDDVKPEFNFDFQPDESKPIPCVMPRYFLDMYNLSYSESMGLPKINEAFALGKRFTLHMGESIITGTSEKSKEVTLQVVGLTPNPSLFVGALIPLRNAEKINEWYTGRDAHLYTAMHVKVSDVTHLDKVTSDIVAMNLNVESNKDMFEKFQFVARAVTMLTAGFAVIIVLIAAVSIWNTFSLIMTQRRGEVGLLRAVGGTRGLVTMLFAGEAVLIGLIAGIVGVTASWLLLRWADQRILAQLPHITILPEHLFILTWPMVFGCIAGAVALSLLTTLPIIISTTSANPATLVSES